MAEIILDKINYTYSDGTAYEIQALKAVSYTHLTLPTNSRV